MAHPLSSIPQPHYAAILTAADDARDAVTAKHGGIPLYHEAVVEGDAAYDRAVEDGVKRYYADIAGS